MTKGEWLLNLEVLNVECVVGGVASKRMEEKKKEAVSKVKHLWIHKEVPKDTYSELPNPLSVKQKNSPLTLFPSSS